tara:strand:- start:1802 stop:3385 length:1584 start_codon:yes stop_codon:yes gene_type:complete
MGPRVLISDRMDSGVVDVLEGIKGLIVDENTELTPKELLGVIGEYDGLIVRSSTKVTEDVIQAGKRLRVIGRAGAGVDNIDVAAATRRGIVVMNTPGGNSTSTAEYSVGLLLALARQVPQATMSVRAGRWERSNFTGVELAGKTLGIVGLGKVGREVALRAGAFKMRILGHDPYVSAEAALTFGAQMVPLHQLYAEADFISVHMHLTEQTRHFISHEEINLCKHGVRIINCARGGIVDEQALFDGLQSGHIAGVALDVLEQEPPEECELLQHEAVICTPHIGASTKEAQASVALQVAEQVGDVLVDKPIRNAVNVPSVEPEVFRILQPYLDLAEYLGRIQAQLGIEQLDRITVEYRGEVTNQPTSPITAAVLKGFMETITDEIVNFVNAPIFAQERGLTLDELKSSDSEDFASLITVIYHGETDRVLSGTIFGKNDPRIVRLDEYHFDAVPEGNMLFYINDDIPGVIGRVGTIMGTHGVNIAQMSCGRHKVGGRALTILNVDSEVSDGVLTELLSSDFVRWATRVSL